MNRLRLFLSQNGQTAMEYLLVTAVSIGLGVTFTKKISGILIDNPNSFIGGHIRNFNKVLNNPGADGRQYKKFRVSRSR